MSEKTPMAITSSSHPMAKRVHVAAQMIQWVCQNTQSILYLINSVRWYSKVDALFKCEIKWDKFYF
jgi:hypothetical protein